MLLSRLVPLAASITTMALVVLGWHLVTAYALVPSVFLPSPAGTFSALTTGLGNGPLLSASLATLQRMISGWLLACIAGISLGAVIGTSPRFERYLGAMLEAFRPIPASALIPLLIALFGLSESMILSAIALGALWPLLLSTRHGVQSVEPTLYDVAAALGMCRLAVIFKIGLPNAVPDILAAMRLSLTIALILTTVCEMLSGNNGLGQWLLVSSRNFASANVFAGIVVLSLFGYLSNSAMNAVEKHQLRWKR
jgi:ABC-type nitrate/sulfonate/bicarbonate transport system permease component